MTDGGGSDDRPSLMRSLGEFVGHVVRGIKTDPAADAAAPEITEISRHTEEERREGVILRRTTIEEVELPGTTPPPSASAPAGPPASDSDPVSPPE